MPDLTRRRSLDHRQECLLIYYGDIHAGTITARVGNPHATDRWEWRCGFYPGSNPGEHPSGRPPHHHVHAAESDAARRPSAVGNDGSPPQTGSHSTHEAILSSIGSRYEHKAGAD